MFGSSLPLAAMLAFVAGTPPALAQAPQQIGDAATQQHGNRHLIPRLVLDLEDRLPGRPSFTGRAWNLRLGTVALAGDTLWRLEAGRPPAALLGVQAALLKGFAVPPYAWSLLTCDPRAGTSHLVTEYQGDPWAHSAWPGGLHDGTNLWRHTSDASTERLERLSLSQGSWHTVLEHVRARNDENGGFDAVPLSPLGLVGGSLWISLADEGHGREPWLIEIDRDRRELRSAGTDPSFGEAVLAPRRPPDP